MIRQRFYPCETCGSEFGKKRRGVGPRCDRHAPKKAPAKRFADQRDPEFTAWLKQQPCLVAGLRGRRLLPSGKRVSWVHECRGAAIDPAHVYRTRAQGVGDLGQCVPLCRWAHTLGGHNQEEHREEFWGWYLLDRDEEVAKIGERWAAFVQSKGAPK